MKTTTTLAILCFGLSCSFAIAQNGGMKQEEKNSDNQSTTFVEFNTVGKKSFVSDVQTIKNYFRASNNNDFRVTNTEIDELGMNHVIHQQYFKGIKVENGVYITHGHGTQIAMMSGDYIPINDNFNIKPAFSEQLALYFATYSLNATEYMWQTEDAANYYSKINGKYAPKGELVIIENFNAKTTAEKIIPHLAYKFDIYTTQPLSRAYIYVDAITGATLLNNPIIHHITAMGAVTTRYSGSVLSKTDLSSGTYRLRDYSRGQGIETFNLKKKINYSQISDFTDANNLWTATEFHNATKDDAALDAQVSLQNTYDYWKNVHGRNSYDNKNSKMTAYVHYSVNYANAFWDGGKLTYGDGNGTTLDPLTTQDITSHEIGHGICQSTANLTFSKESGALNEALSDIWGACIEYFYFPTKKTWYIGEDADLAAHKGFRNMANPNEFKNPDTYKGTYWYAGTDDSGGVHTNSGVINYCFYLLAVGGKGTNDIGKTFSVTGIGITYAAKIFYRAESVYMTSSTNFAGARTACIQAAKDLYGAGSQQEKSITNAFYAVGVGAVYPTTTLAAFNAPTNLQHFDFTANAFKTTWKPVVGATEYEVEIWDGTNWSNAATTTTNNAEVIGLSKLADAIWRVVAKNEKGDAAPSESKQILANQIVNVEPPNEEIVSYHFYPNPAKDFLQLQYQANEDTEVEIQIVDILGRTFFQKMERVESGNNEIQLNIQQLPQGRYLLKVINLSNPQASKRSTKALILE